MLRDTRSRTTHRKADEGGRVEIQLLAPLLAVWLWASPTAAQNIAVNLSDPTPRWVEVAFETSPNHLPGQLSATYSPPFRAWLEPGPLAGQVRVTVDAEIVEKHLLGRQEPVPGSFSDFVWLFDAETGHVQSASLTGEVVAAVDMGWIQTSAVTRLSVQMDSRGMAGFRRRSRILGNEFFRYCAEPDSKRCRIVTGAALDRETGYVNAVGVIAAVTGLVELRTFSPLGEALFREGSPTALDVSAAPPHSVAAETDVSLLESH